MNRKRLQEVLRVRMLQERGARGELARSTQRHRRAHDAEARTWDRLESWPASGEGAGLWAMQSVRESGMLAAETQHAITERALETVHESRAEWQRAARRVEALDRLAERLREAEAAEAERLQINEIDDLVLARRGRSAT